MNRIMMMHGTGKTRQLTLRFLDCQVSRDVIAVGRSVGLNHWFSKACVRDPFTAFAREACLNPLQEYVSEEDYRAYAEISLVGASQHSMTALDEI